MGQHCEYVWGIFMKFCPAKKVFIVAHSAGGGCAFSLLSKFCQLQRIPIVTDFKKRVSCIALSDSFPSSGYDSETQKYNKEVSIIKLQRIFHFKASAKKLGTSLEAKIVKTYSAGHTDHEYATGAAKKEVFKLFTHFAKIHI